MLCKLYLRIVIDTVEIREVAPEAAYAVSTAIRELHPPYPWSKWKDRLTGKQSICLVAYNGNEPVGCKVGYFETDHFYSWVGGVREGWRRKGIARMLAERMEDLVLEHDVRVIRMKTMSRFKGMLLFALGDGFDIVSVEPGADHAESAKIVLEKKL